MGLLDGGDSNSSTFTTVQNYQATSSPQVDQSGAAGTTSTIISPQAVGGGTFGPITSTSYNSPLYLTNSVNYGDTAVQASAATARAQIGASGPSSSAFSLSDIFSGTNIYWILGALVVLMFARGHHHG